MPISASDFSAVLPAASMSSPSASSVSAAPALLLAARLPCLATGTPAGGDDQADRGRDVERVMPVAAGAADVDRALGRVDRDQPCAQRARRAGDFVGGFAAFGQFGEEAGDLVLAHLAVEQRAEDSFGLCFAEMRFGRGQCLHAGTCASIPHRPRKFASSAWPCSVAMISGWNCTPWIGSSRWRKPITWVIVAGGVDRQRTGNVLDDERMIAGRGERARAARRTRRCRHD